MRKKPPQKFGVKHLRKIILYTTDGCHLCEEASQLLNELSTSMELHVSSVDIATDEELVSLYGIRIPVIRRIEDGQELGWPFNRVELALFINPA